MEIIQEGQLVSFAVSSGERQWFGGGGSEDGDYLIHFKDFGGVYRL